MNIINKGAIKTNIISKVINEQANDKETGAHSIFLGQVRADKLKGKKVKHIEYTAYEEMLLPEVDNIKKIINEKYDQITKIIIVHSVGEVKAGELSLFVFVGSKHREQSFKASKEIVELIKKKLPVWKKEVLEDDSSEWKLKN